MAQLPDTKVTNATNEATPNEGERKARAAAGQAANSEQSLNLAGAVAAQHGGQAARDSSREMGNALRQRGAAGAEATRATAAAGAEVGRRGAEALAQGHHQLLEQTAERFETIGRRMAQAVEETAAGVRSFVLAPDTATDRLRDMQESVSGLVNGVVQSNVRAAQELLRMTDPEAVFNLQRRFMRDYMDAMLQGTSTLVRAAQQTAEQTLRPIEARLEERQRNGHEPRNQQHQENGIVSDVMSSDVKLATPDDTVQQATRLMRDEDTGVLPVGEGDRLVGVVTDRDVAMRLVAEGKDPVRTKVREVMTQEVKYVYEDEDLAHVADNMAEQQVRRLPVVNRNKRVVGVISLGDLARGGRSARYVGPAMRGVARDTGRQLPDAAE